MSDTSDHGTLPDDDLLAAEYALGVLGGAERAQAATRIARDDRFAALVVAWEARLAPWAGEIDEVAPPPQIWQAIAGALPAPPRRGMWESLAFWRIFAVASTLAAACLAAFLYLGVGGNIPPLVATIEGGGQRNFVATVDVTRATVAVVPASFSADATRVPELWLIPQGGKPFAVGVLRADRAVVIALPPPLLKIAASGATLAVSLEPPGGSPTGQPTGPVIGAGKLTSL